MQNERNGLLLDTKIFTRKALFHIKEGFFEDLFFD